MLRALEAMAARRMMFLVLADVTIISSVLIVCMLVMSPAARLPADLATKVAIPCLVLLACLHYFDLYEFRVGANLREVAPRLSQVLGTACVILATLYYAYPTIQLRRPVVLAGVLAIATGLLGIRKLFWAMNLSPRLSERTLLLGSGPLAIQLAAELAQRPELGRRVVGYVGNAEATPSNLTWIGPTYDLVALVERERIRRIILTMGERRGTLPLEGLVELKSRGVQIEEGVDAYEEATAKVALESLRLGWLLSFGFGTTGNTLLYKRILAVVFSIIGIIVTAPLMLIVALAVRLESPGPMIFRQKRVGQGGRLFTLYKFRSMRVGADSDGIARPVQEKDTRLTRFGRILRRSRLDELPQLFNILRGDLDFVGPRPFVPEQEEECVAQIPFYRYRWTVKPGATGWAQIHRGYCATIADNAEKLAYDLFYIKHVSLSLDLLILFQTLKILLLGRGGR